MPSRLRHFEDQAANPPRASLAGDSSKTTPIMSPSSSTFSFISPGRGESGVTVRPARIGRSWGSSAATGSAVGVSSSMTVAGVASYRLAYGLLDRGALTALAYVSWEL